MQQLHCYLQHPLTSVVAMTTMQTGRLDTDADGQWARKKHLRHLVSLHTTITEFSDKQSGASFIAIKELQLSQRQHN